MKHFIDRFSDTRIFVFRTKETGHICGKLLAKYGNSGTCTVGLYLYESVTREKFGKSIDFSKTKKAGGYGYDKFEHAFRLLIAQEFGFNLKGGGYYESIKEFAELLNIEIEQIL